MVGEPFDPNLHDRATGPDADKVLAEKVRRGQKNHNKNKSKQEMYGSMLLINPVEFLIKRWYQHLSFVTLPSFLSISWKYSLVRLIYFNGRIQGAGAAPSTVVWELAEGKRMKAGVIRRALVAVAPSADSAPAAEAPPAAETPAAEAAADATPPSEP